MMYCTLRSSILACAWLLMAPQVSEAQGRRGPPARQEMERQVRQRFQEVVVRELGLDAAQGRALAAVVEDFQGERAAIVRREMGVRQRLRGTGALLSETAASEVLEEMARIQEAEAELLRREQERLLEVLTPPQAVRFYMLRADLGERIRRMRGGGPER